jgi:adenylyltransferase/sulfurtransferase
MQGIEEKEAMPLSKEEVTRYSRHILLPELGRQGQEKLRASSVLVIGVGGLGCPAAQYLAAAGVGRLGLMDPDKVELSNLQRQILHATPDLGTPKVASAAAKLAALDPGLKLDLLEGRLEPGNALEAIQPYDLVVEGADNFEAKFLANDACVSLGKPLLQAGIRRFEAQILSVLPGGPCYRCLFEAPPPPGRVGNCASEGVLGAVAGVAGSLLAAEAVKLLLGLGQPLAGRLLLYDALACRFRELAFKRRPGCSACARAGSHFQPEVEGGARCAPETQAA